MTNIIALDDKDEPIELTIIDTIVVANNTYIVATQEDPFGDVVNASVLKETNDTNDYATYSFVEEKEEVMQVMKSFNQTSEYDIDIEF